MSATVLVVGEVRRGIRRRSAVVLAAAGVLVTGLFAARVLLGDFTVTIPDFVRILGGAQVPSASFIVMESKLPAAVVGALAGVAFGTAGACFQTMLRNPLASPDVIGVTLGSSAAAVFAVVVLGWSSSGRSLAALLGGLAVALAIHRLAGGSGVVTHRMILVGIGASAALQAVIQWVLLRSSIYQAQEAMVWLTGSLNAMPWSGAARLAVVLVVCLPLTAALVRALRTLEVGDDLALALGTRASRIRLLLLGVVVVMTATATSVCGPIAFVAFLSGPIARRLNVGRPSVALSGLVGAAIVLAADYASSYLLGSVQLPVGVVTGLAGAPFLLVLLVLGPRRIKE